MICLTRFSHSLLNHKPINKSLSITTDVCACAYL